MTDEGIALEYEARLAYAGEPKKVCPQCGRETFMKYCKTCKTPKGEPLPLSGDQQLDELRAKMDAGEEIEDLEALIRGQFVPIER